MISYFSLPQLRTILDINLIDTSSNLTDDHVVGITTDSREIQPGEIFIALTGDNFDGHSFINIAIAAGAIAVIVSQPLTSLSVPQFIVQDTLKAYQQIASWWRDRFEIPVIGITGSVGKTSTKELVSAVLSTQGKVLKPKLISIMK